MAPELAAAKPPLTAAQAALPTLGATIGSAVGALVAAQFGGNDPLIGHTITAVITGIFTAVFHWAGTKLGVASL
jgi:hypothetical protein